jgi:riboflavin kinase / FMN adenylyltransferase
MIIITDPGRLAGAFRRPALTIGNFDGVHLGHQSLLRLLRREADRRGVDAVILTFDPHPLQVLAPDRCPPMIQTWPQKVVILQELGVDGVVVYPFTPEFSRTPAADFVRDLLAGTLRTSALVLGERFTFGYKRQGSVALLRELAPACGYEVLGIEETAHGETPVSSTAIRQCLAEGRLEEAAALLGRPYAIDGVVAPGLRLGRRLGFPTANVATENQLLVPNGVFAATVSVGETVRPAAVSVGIRPTVDTGVPVSERRPELEAFLLDFEGDLYGRAVRIRLHALIRPERHFATMEELQAQMARDVAECRRILAGPGGTQP